MEPTALITGSAKRIGKAMAVHLAKLGWNVIIHYSTSEKEAKELVSQLETDYPQQQFGLYKANLERPGEVEKMIPGIVSRFGPFQLLVNNASVFHKNTISQTSGSFFDTQVAVNLKAPFILTRDFATYCKSGIIINLLDTRIHSNLPGYAVYTLAKKALWELTKMAAVEFAPQIRVNAIAPGATLPPEDKSESYLKALAEKTPMKTPTGLDPVLKCVDFIVISNHLTGQLLYADGGENLIPR